MFHSLPKLARIAIVGAGGAALVIVGPGVAAGAATSHATVHATPKLRADVYAKRTVLHGVRTFKAGRVSVALTAHGTEREVQVAKFAKGYSFAKLRADIATFGRSQGPKGPSKAGLQALRHAINHTTLYGGADADAGHTVRFSVVLPKAGTYVLYNDSGNLPAQPKYLKVTGPAVKRAVPKSGATVIGNTAQRFGGASVLPAKGTITFRNTSTESPHLLGLLHVKAGTTRKQVLDYFASGAQRAPPFALKGSAGTDAVSPGHSQTLSYSLPKGTYVEVCFFPDPKTGMPHAFTGMVRIVKLK